MSASAKAWANGLLGVLIFSGSLPATRLAVAGFDPVFLTCARAVLAALLGLALLGLFRAPQPALGDLGRLTLVALGVVVGFPLLTALALQHISTARSIVFIGILPLATALFGVLVGGERPRWPFWLFALAGSGVVAGYAIANGASGVLTGDLLMLGAIIACGAGYAEGARLSARLGGWQVISWALLLALGPMLAGALATWPSHAFPVTSAPWIGLAYVAVFSMLVGFVFWYRALAQGGTAAISQLQLLQPFFGLLLAALVLGETVDMAMLSAAGLVVLMVAGAKRYA